MTQDLLATCKEYFTLRKELERYPRIQEVYWVHSIIEKHNRLHYLREEIEKGFGIATEDCGLSRPEVTNDFYRTVDGI